MKDEAELRQEQYFEEILETLGLWSIKYVRDSCPL